MTNSIIDIVRQVCQNHPDKIAIRSSNGNITFAEFLRRINGLASTLRQHSITPGARIAIHLERSIEMVVAIFGALACGAVYVPLDPENPTSRLQQIVEDSDPSFILSRADGSTLSQSVAIPRLDPDDWSQDGPGFPLPDTKTAYIIYTSGSTGKPKGVVVGHASLQNYLAWFESELVFTGGGAPLLASSSFDHSVSCYFPPLMKGESLTLLPPLQGGRALASGLLTGHHYSYVKITPSHARLLSPEQRAELGLSTDLIIFGGERLSWDLIADVRRNRSDLQIINHYGPTEATVGCCYYRVPFNLSGEGSVPIGKPIAGADAVIASENESSFESNGAGELLIGGEALALGYWRQPELTNKSFVEIADKHGHSHRWYRTGDLVRRLVDGNFEFIGRIDDQIKILGHRIELEEINQALHSNSMIRECTVLAAQRNHSVEIVAAVSTCEENQSVEQLRDYLRAMLPATMVPARIVFFEKLPVNASGKLDRKTILDKAYAESPRPLVQNMEDLVAAKFSEALGVSNIQLCDDFFELGGDSMAAVEIVMWASDYFRVPLETPALFEHSTIQLLTEHIRLLLSADNQSALQLTKTTSS